MNWIMIPLNCLIIFGTIYKVVELFVRKRERLMLINLFYYEDLPLHDIAYVLGLESGNVATRLHRIRKKLYIIIKRMEQHELFR